MLNYSVSSSFISIKKNTTDTAVSYLEILLEIDSEDRLRTKLYDKIDEFNFPHWWDIPELVVPVMISLREWLAELSLCDQMNERVVFLIAKTMW